jgi:hypothetical protein
MGAIHIKAFRGEVPRLSPRLLQPNQALRAQNCKLTSGRLDPLRGLGFEATTTRPIIKTLFRYRHFVKGEPVDLWLTFENDVDIVKSLLPNDPHGRVFYTADDHEPRMATYNTITAGSPQPAAWFVLGVPSPTTAPTIASVTGGSGPNESRAYAFTFVTPLGEESGPSPASAVFTGHASGTWNLTNLQEAPPNSGTITTAAANTPTTGITRVTLDTTFGLAPFDTITIASVTGMTDLNGVHRIQAVNGNQVDLILTTAQTYTSGGTWARNAPHNTSGMTRRIYRTTGTSGDFLFVAEIPVTNTTYDDSVLAADLGEILPTVTTLPPPKNLRALISLPNGCLVGVAGNELCFSDPYMPYSWPIGNRYSFSGQGVALAPAGSSVIVLTDTFPILFTGSDPEAMSPSVMETYAPCVSKRGTVYVGGGCIYPSFDGLWLAAPGRVESLTKKLFREREWAALSPATMDAEFFDAQYIAAYRTPQGVRRVFVFDVDEADSIVEVDESADALHRNEYDGRLYVTKANQIYQWDANPGRAYNSDWISMTFQTPMPKMFSTAQVHAEYGQIVPVDNSITQANEALIAAGPDAVAGHLNGMEFLTTEVNGSFIVPNIPDLLKKVQFTLYVDNQAVFTRALTDSQPFRLPANYCAEVFNVGLECSVPTYSVTIASSVAELAQASA